LESSLIYSYYYAAIVKVLERKLLKLVCLPLVSLIVIGGLF